MNTEVNIDLFLTDHGENGLICDRALPERPSGVILDAETNLLTIEFGESGDTLHLNIPIEDSYKEKLLFSQRIQIGVLENGIVIDHAEVGLLYLNDPYGSDFGDVSHRGRPSRSLIRFEQFMKRCIFAQAVHRADFGDESTAGSVLSGVNPRALQFAPQLIRQIALEAGPRAAQNLSYGMTNAPGPSGTSGPKGPGGMGAGSGHPVRRVIQKQPPPSENDDE